MLSRVFEKLIFLWFERNKRERLIISCVIVVSLCLFVFLGYTSTLSIVKDYQKRAEMAKKNWEFSNYNQQHLSFIANNPNFKLPKNKEQLQNFVTAFIPNSTSVEVVNKRVMKVSYLKIKLDNLLSIIQNLEDNGIRFTNLQISLTKSSDDVNADFSIIL